MTDEQQAYEVELALGGGKHVWFKCRTPCEGYHCQFCDGGLSACTVCKCIEGSLATECPGFDCYDEFGTAIYAGEIDFRSGDWVPLPSEHAPYRVAKSLGKGPYGYRHTTCCRRGDSPRRSAVLSM